MGFIIVCFSDVLTAEEESRPAGLTSMDSSRRRVSGPILNSGSFLKQKNPVANDPSNTKDALVSFYIFLPWLKFLIVLDAALSLSVIF